MKSLKASEFDKIQSKRRRRRSQATAFGTGRFKFQKRSSFHKGERGRQAVVYMEGVMSMGLVSFHLFPMYKNSFPYGKRVASHLYIILKHSKYRHERKESKRIYVKDLPNHLYFYCTCTCICIFFFSLSFCNLNLIHLYRI